MSKRSDRIRVEWAANDAKRDEGLTTPENVVRFDDLSYGPDSRWQKLDVYRPKGVEGKLPVIVNVHGGGWVYGDKELYQFYSMSLCQFGFAVVNFTYRLAPEFKFPAAIEDTNLVMKFIVENAEEYGLDPDNVFGVGDSAGGNLLALYACFVTNREYQKSFGFKPAQGFSLNGVALNCGAYCTVNPTREGGINPETLEDMFTNGGSKEEMEWVDVPSHVTRDFPPAYIMTGSKDFLRQDAPRLAECLVDRGVPFEFKYWHTKGQEFYHVFHVNMKHPFAKECNALECQFFKQYLKTESL